MPPRKPVGLPKISDVMSAVGKSCYESATDAAKRGVDYIKSLKQTDEDKLVTTLYIKEKHRRKMNDHKGLPSTYHKNSGVDLELVKNTQYRRILGTDIDASELSMGMSAAAGTYSDVSEDVAVQTVQEAYRSGINYFDTAPLYGYNRSGEYLLGEALKGKPRNSYYVSTKVGRYLEEVKDPILGGTRWVGVNNYSSDVTAKSVERSLELLNVDYLDIVYIHDIGYSKSYKTARNSCLLTLVNLQEQGMINHIGLSGYDLTLLSMIFKEETQLETTGIGEARHCHVFQTVGRYNLLDRLLTSTKSIPFRFLEHTINNNVGIINAAPLNMGLFTPNGPPRWHSAPPQIRECCAEIVELCESNNVDVVRVALFFALQQKAIGTNLVGLASPEEVRNAVSVMQSTPTPEESYCLAQALALIEELDYTHWTERDAIISGSGNVNDDAVGASHYSDTEIVNTPFVSGRGQLQFEWRGKYGHRDTAG